MIDSGLILKNVFFLLSDSMTKNTSADYNFMTRICYCKNVLSIQYWMT